MSDGPINYGVAFANIPSPFDAFAKGLNTGNALQQTLMAPRIAAAQQRRAQMVEAARQKVLSPNATAEDRVNYLSLVSPEQSKAMQTAIEQMDKAKIQDANKAALDVAGAIDSGNLDVARQLLDARAQSYENQGTDQAAQQAGYIRNVLLKGIDTNPAFVKGHLLDMVALSPTGKDDIDAYNANKERQPRIDLLEAQAAEAWANANKATVAARQAPPEIKKDITDIAQQGVANANLANQHDALADKLSKMKVPAGIGGKALSDALKALGFDTGAWNDAQNEYERLKAQGGLQAIQSLKGATSDKDVAFALSGWPGNDAPPDQRARFLKGIAKIERYNSQVNSAQIDWMRQNGWTLTPTDQDIVVNGTEVPAGTSWQDFVSKNIPFTAPAANIGTETGSSANGAATPKSNTPQKTVTVDW